VSEKKLRDFPKGVAKKGTTREFIKAYRAAFDADPAATFCAGEVDGITLVLAVRRHGIELQDFVKGRWDGMIQRGWLK
jgi:hypothetical protein